eukprot:scaffold251559_cov96-Cyclotella_meneghiniana.AAC.1
MARSALTKSVLGYVLGYLHILYQRDRVGSRVYPITLRSSRVGIPPTKIPVPVAFYPGIGFRVSTRGTDSPLRKVARYALPIYDTRVLSE